MAEWIIPGARSLSEFVGLPVHSYGDCGEDAVLMALHAIAPAKYPLTPYGLGHLVTVEESEGYADAGGAQNIEHMDAYLTHAGIPHTTFGYSTPDVVDKLHAQLQKFLGAHSLDPVVVEYAAAGAGFADDERNVQYHFNTWLGESDDRKALGGEFTGGYYKGDGDSRYDSQTGAATYLVLTAWQDIVKAQPIAYIVIHQTVDRVIHGPRIVL